MQTTRQGPGRLCNNGFEIESTTPGVSTVPGDRICVIRNRLSAPLEHDCEYAENLEAEAWDEKPSCWRFAVQGSRRNNLISSGELAARGLGSTSFCFPRFSKHDTVWRLATDHGH